MNNQKGFGLLGFLVAALLAGLLVTWALKQYSGTVTRALNPLSAEEPARRSVPAGTKANPGARGTDAVVQNGTVPGRLSGCDGKQVGNICVPTRMHSGQDDFDKLYK